MLLERDGALQVLEGALDRAARGAGFVVLVSGEAGIGKTSLVRAFLRAAAHRATVLQGACDDLLTPRTSDPSVTPPGPGAARSPPPSPTATTRENPAGLTDRQVEILRMLADGATNAEIAARLVLSVRTVDHHVSAVLQKLGVPGRREAIAAATDLGIRR